MQFAEFPRVQHDAERARRAEIQKLLRRHKEITDQLHQLGYMEHEEPGSWSAGGERGHWRTS